jgi:TP901-1 family phage major tail protein
MSTSTRTGRTLLLKDGLLVGSATIAAMRTTSFRIAGTTVDVTDKDSPSQHRELLAGAGVASVSISAAGLLTGNTQAQTLVTRTLARTADDYRLEFDNGDVITGKFQLVNFEASGEYNREQTYALTLESAALLTFTPAA